MTDKIMTVMAYVLTVLSAVMIVSTWGDGGNTLAWTVAFIAWLQIAMMKKG